MRAKGKVFKYGNNVDTDVIIPARYLNTSDPAELAKHCMEDIDSSCGESRTWDIIVVGKNFVVQFTGTRPNSHQSRWSFMCNCYNICSYQSIISLPILEAECKNDAGDIV